MKNIKHLVGFCLLLTVLTSCYSKRYLKRVTNNIDDFTDVIAYLENNGYTLKQDTIFGKDNTPLSIKKSSCWSKKNFREDTLKHFFSKYDLKNLCYSKEKDNYFDSLISFHRDYNPFGGKSIMVFYDFGRSKLRSQIIEGTLPDNAKYGIINDLFIYRVNRRPAFGE